jgi:signal transduction histidine kinase
MFIIYVLFIFCFSLGSVHAENQITDSLLVRLNKTENTPEKIDILIELINQKLNNLDHDNYKYLNEAKELLKKYPNSDKKAEINILFGEYWKIFGDYPKSVEYILKAIKHFEQKNDKESLAYSYTKIAESYRAANKHDKAIEFLEKAENLIRNSTDGLLLAKIYNRKAAVYFEIPDTNFTKRSIEFAEKSIKLLDSLKDYHLIINNLNILAAFNMNLYRYDSAEYHLLSALSLCKKHDDFYNYPTILTNLCDLYYRKGDLQKSLKYGLECNEFREKRQLETMEPYLYLCLSRIYTDIGDYKNANKFLKKTLDAKESIYSESKNKALLELEIKYETEKMEDQIKDKKKYSFYQTIIFISLALLLLINVFVLYLRHIKLKKKNKKIGEQNFRLEEVNITKDKFFSIIAHDLKNPISTFAEVIKIMENDFDTMKREEAKEFLFLMRESANRLSMLLNNLLTWSRSQRGVIEYNPDTYNTIDIIQENIKLLKIQAERKNIKLGYENTSGYKIKADINMLNTILSNLISNAIKFTQKGGEIVVETKDIGDFIRFTVKDSGKGMSDEFISKLFRIDKNITSQGTNDEKGTGLGLIICKEFVEKHGGRIWVESKPGKGSTFYFTIPKH